MELERAEVWEWERAGEVGSARVSWGACVAGGRG